MKFVAKKEAPDIPLELLEAQEAGRLVLFCGAGIDCSIGLPNYKELIENLYKILNFKMDDLEKEAFKGKLYDRTLDLLEKRTKQKELIRKTIKDSLAIDPLKKLPVHTSILELSKTKDGSHRLVTTNVSLGFKNVAPNIKIISAPYLPIPKYPKLQGIVHLHGIFDDENDPSGNDLILSSSDFGKAYLIDGFCSRFVGELFRQFCVLFVGYSANDPIIRYMIDAIAAERSNGNEDFISPYIIIHTTPSERDTKRAYWKAMGIEPIIYSGRHNYLQKTLEEWAEYYRDGLLAKERIIRVHAQHPPLFDSDDEDYIKQVIDTLREKTNPNDPNITGYPAKIFKDIKAPIEWLPNLDKKDLLSLAVSNDKTYAISNTPQITTPFPNIISLRLWEWLTHYLESNELVKWAIKQGLHLHPELSRLIKNKLESNDKPNEPYLTFWRILILGKIKNTSAHDTFNFECIYRLKESADTIAINQIMNLVEPHFKISYLSEDISKESGENLPYTVDIELLLSDWAYDELKQVTDYPKIFINNLLQLTTNLKKALEYLEFIGKANDKDDRSHWDIASLEPHEQNHHYSSWVILIELCRDVWEEAWTVNRPLALSILELWKSIKYPAFLRLVLYIYATKSLVDTNSKLSYVIENNGWWLWSEVTKRECFRLLKSIASNISEKDSKILFDTILNGPPRELYLQDLSEEDWQNIVDRKIWLVLTKLQTFGFHLCSLSKQKLASLNKVNPDWKLQDDDRDEFSFWMESRIGYETDITAYKLLQLSPTEIIEILSEKRFSLHDGRIDQFRLGCSSNPLKCIEILKYLKENSIWSNDIWHAALVGLAQSGEPPWRITAQILVASDNLLFINEPWAIAWWSKEATKKITPDSNDEKLLFQIADRLFESANEIISFKERSSINVAINNSIGIITEVLMIFFSKQYSKDKKERNKSYLNRFEGLFSIPRNQFLLAGRILLASQLSYFYAKEPEWTKKHLLPAFNSKLFPDESLQIWSAYLWSPKINIELAYELKDILIVIIERRNEFTSEDQYQLYSLFTHICIEYENLYNPSQQNTIMHAIGHEGLKSSAKFIWSGSGKDNIDNYWNNRIESFIQRAWPKEKSFASEESSEYLVRFIINLISAFPKAVQVILSLLIPFKNLRSFLDELVQTELPEKYPKETFAILSKVFTTEYQWPSKNISQIVDRILVADASIHKHPVYKTIREFIIFNNL